MFSVRPFLIEFVSIATQLMILALFARVIFSWFPGLSRGRLYVFLLSATEPVLRVARRVTPRLGMIDISPIIAFIGLDLLRYFLLRLLGV